MKKQQGMSFWVILVLLVFGIGSILLGMKLFPAYMDNLKLKEGLQTLADDPENSRLTKGQLIKRLDNILYIDFAHEIVDLKKAFKTRKTQTSTIMTINYERVIHLAFNISALLDFENEVEMKTR
ncbi:MAG: DUF4845 domain-containing protein [Gammaproteobacteria bacterium]|nr:DUF4845 domain-containing protein [Gammaproteobacteria bacterium]